MQVKACHETFQLYPLILRRNLIGAPNIPDHGAIATASFARLSQTRFSNLIVEYFAVCPRLSTTSSAICIIYILGRCTRKRGKLGSRESYRIVVLCKSLSSVHGR